MRRLILEWLLLIEASTNSNQYKQGHHSVKAIFL
jgi:hypothetical protein